MGLSSTEKPEVLTDAKRGLLSMWESFQPKNGELGTSLILKPKIIQSFETYEKEQYVLVKAQSGKPITYYIGAGWTKNPHFKTKQAWVDYVQSELVKINGK